MLHAAVLTHAPVRGVRIPLRKGRSPGRDVDSGPFPGRPGQKLMLPIIPAMLVVNSLIVGAIVDDAM